MNKAQVI